MRSYQVKDFESGACFTEGPVPLPGADQVQVRIQACGLNFADTLMIKGTYQDIPPLPATLGLELAGVVTALGQGVTTLKLGQRVACFAGHGGLAEYAVVPAARCIPVPDSMPITEAAGFQIAYGTSHLALAHAARLRPGETLLVTGAAGGVGLTAIEIGKRLGARVIAVARGADKLQVALDAGADAAVDSDSPTLADELKAMGSVDVVYDSIGGPLFKPCFRACKFESRYLVIGFASGDVPQIPANHLLVKNISVIGFYLGGYMTHNLAAFARSQAELMGWYAEGRLKPHVSHVLPFDQVEAGLDLLRTRKSTGKVVISIAD